MKAKQMMDKDFIYASKDDSVVDISIRMDHKDGRAEEVYSSYFR